MDARWRRLGAAAPLFLCTLWLGCVPAAVTEMKEDAGQGPLALCNPAPGTTGHPESIEEALALLNGLPFPVTMPCFLHSLVRPLDLSLTFSQFSQQPADGVRSPRVFILNGPLVMSVVPSGKAANLLEFGEQIGNNQSIKGELLFPLVEAVDMELPFKRVMFDDTHTSCSFCHGGEAPVVGRPYISAFSSIAFRPLFSNLVPLSSLKSERDICDPAKEKDRCDVLSALFDFGETRTAEFPPDMSECGQ